MIFEKDNWPAKLNHYEPTGRSDLRAGPSQETPSWKLWYRSADFKNEGRNLPYYTGTIVNNYNYHNFGLYYFDAVVTNNSAIRFRILGY